MDAIWSLAEYLLKENLYQSTFITRTIMDFIELCPDHDYSHNGISLGISWPHLDLLADPKMHISPCSQSGCLAPVFTALFWESTAVHCDLMPYMPKLTAYSFFLNCTGNL